MGDFQNYLVLNGIIKEKGEPYTHHYPGKVERSHQTVMRMAHAMLRESKLPPKFYNEAQKCAAYLFNRMPHGQEDKTPYELIFNKKPDLSNLKPFGCVCYAYAPPEKVNKLQENGIRCRLLGYGDDFDEEEMKGYRLLREDDLGIFYSNNVTFDKDYKMEKLSD
jgi:hypothetical protein